ncbi:MAG: gluconate 2-dehydrogenase subunit 3 family protein, partial [Nitrososphaerales archaeon]
MSEDNKTQTNEIATVEEHEQTMTRQDRAREKIQQAVNDQQVALAAQQRAVQSTSDAFLAEQDLARRERAGSSQGEIASRGQHAESESRRNFLKISVGVVAGAAIASVVQVPLYAGLVPSRNSDIHTLQAQATSARQEASQLQAQLTAAQTQISQDNAYLILNPDEWSLVEAIGETFIPSDSSGPGFKEAGGIYFIDRQLDGEYGTNGNMYMDSPYVVPGTLGPITVGTQTYLGGAPTVRLGAGTRYQYPLRLRDYWRIGLAAFQSYSNLTYGGDFETLSPANKVQALTDLYNNMPSNFSITIPGFTNGSTVMENFDIVPQDFFYDLYYMCWCGFLMDPAYGGNQNLVGWTYTGFNGTNMGNFYNEGHTDQELMVATTATRLQPASLAQFQQASGGSQSPSSSGSSQSSSSSSSSSSTSAPSGGTSSSSSAGSSSSGNT